MDNQVPVNGPTSPPQPTPLPPTAPTPPVNAKHAHRFILGYIALIVLIAAVAGVYTWQHKKVSYLSTQVNKLTAQVNSLEKQSSTNKSKANKSTTTTSTQQYLTISTWGVRVPYQSGDTLSASGQTCTENGDAAGDTVNLGCQVAITSQDLANSVGSCTAKVSGKVGYFYKMGPNDNYSATNGSGYTPVAQWVASNPGQYTKIGSYYYAFDEIGEASGGSGAAVADSNTVNGTYTGCSAWQTEYNNIEQSVQGLASKFEAIPN